MLSRRRFLLSGASAALASRVGLLTPGVAAAQAAPEAAGVRLAVPFVTQFDGTVYAATNCGPTNLAMVLRYFHRPEGATPDTLRRALARLPGAGYAADPAQGTAIQDLVTLARQRGLRPVMGPGPSSTGWTPTRLGQQLAEGRPTIVLTRLNALPGWGSAPDGYQHWIVLVGATADRARFLYNDSALSGPAGAARPLSREALVRAMALAVIPTQGAAFGALDGAVYPKLPVDLPADDRATDRVVVGLVRLGNGALGARPPIRLSFTPGPGSTSPGAAGAAGSLWDGFVDGRFVAV